MNIPRLITSSVMIAVVLILLLTALARSQAPEITVTVSDFKGSPGEIVRIPVYITDISVAGATEMSFSLKSNLSVLRFRNLLTPYDTLLWSSNGYFEEFRRGSEVTAVFSNTVPLQGSGKLVVLEFEVVGEKGQSGEVKMTNFALGSEVLPSESLILGEFRVFPVAEYANDGIEITSKEVFTSFELELTGQADLLSIQDYAGWTVHQEGDIIFGHGDAGVTSITVPVSSEGQNVEIYSLKLNQDETVRFKQRELFMPYARN